MGKYDLSGEEHEVKFTVGEVNPHDTPVYLGETLVATLRGFSAPLRFYFMFDEQGGALLDQRGGAEAFGLVFGDNLAELREVEP